VAKIEVGAVRCSDAVGFDKEAGKPRNRGMERPWRIGCSLAPEEPMPIACPGSGPVHLRSPSKPQRF